MWKIKNILDKVSLILFNEEFIELTFWKVFIVDILLWTGLYFIIYIIALFIYLIIL